MMRACAKLTLSLRIAGVRNDGYHLIDAEMVTLDLVDTLSSTLPGDGLSASGPLRRRDAARRKQSDRQSIAAVQPHGRRSRS